MRCNRHAHQGAQMVWDPQKGIRRAPTKNHRVHRGKPLELEGICRIHLGNLDQFYQMHRVPYVNATCPHECCVVIKRLGFHLHFVMDPAVAYQKSQDPLWKATEAAWNEWRSQGP